MPTLFARHISLRTILLGSVVLCLCGVLALYALFQARHLLEGPVITLISEELPYSDDPTMILTGKALNIVSLSLNGRSIYTNDSGDFKETLVLPSGYTIMTITAQDRYGRTHSLERVYVRSEQPLLTVHN